MVNFENAHCACTYRFGGSLVHVHWYIVHSCVHMELLLRETFGFHKGVVYVRHAIERPCDARESFTVVYGRHEFLRFTGRMERSANIYIG